MTVSRIQQFELQLQRQHAQERAEAILEESPPALREKIAWIRNYFDDEWRRSILGRYQIAVIIREIYDDVNEHNGAAYGAKAVEAIKRAFGWDNGVIYQALQVADAFTPDQVESIAQMRLPGGQPVSYSHVVALASVEDARKRQKLLTQAVQEGWTSKKLANAVDRAVAPRPANREDRRGRPLAKPRDFDAVLDQQGDFALDFLNRNREVWAHHEHSLSAKLEDLDPAAVTQERADRLKRHADAMSLLAQKAQERADEAKHIHEQFLHALKEQAATHKRLGTPTTRPGSK